jgi:hypothetical protein
MPTDLRKEDLGTKVGHLKELLVVVDHHLVEVVQEVHPEADHLSEEVALADLVVIEDLVLALQEEHHQPISRVFPKNLRRRSIGKRKTSPNQIVIMNVISRSKGRVSIVPIRFLRKSTSWKSLLFPISQRK